MTIYPHKPRKNGLATRAAKVALAVCVGLAGMAKLGAQTTNLADAPKPIQELAATIQGKRSSEVRAALVERLGAPQRDVGSGLKIEQWDTADGVLTFHPGTGPTFFNPKTKAVFRLLQTKNPAGSNIMQGYEMTTLPDPANHGMRSWLGNVKFGSDMSYRFVDSAQNRDHRDGQKENFFMLHPTGTVAVRYMAPVESETLLESLAEGATVAQLVFTSADHKHEATFSITSSERDRHLDFGADKALPFMMETSWKSFWR